MSSSSDASVAQAARAELNDASRVLVFDESGHVLYSSFQARILHAQLQAATHAGTAVVCELSSSIVVNRLMSTS